MVIRLVEPGDETSLRDNCYSATPVDEVRHLVKSSLPETVAGRAVMLVAVDDVGQVAGNLTLTRHHQRLQRHRAEIDSSFIPGCRAVA
jgi:hypothetical protein